VVGSSTTKPTQALGGPERGQPAVLGLVGRIPRPLLPARDDRHQSPRGRDDRAGDGSSAWSTSLIWSWWFRHPPAGPAWPGSRRCWTAPGEELSGLHRTRASRH